LYRKAEHLTGEQVLDEYAWKLWLPSELIPEVLFQAHNSPLASHGGKHKTVERVRRYYFSPRLVPDVKAYVNACETCKSNISQIILFVFEKKPFHKWTFCKHLYKDKKGNIQFYMFIYYLKIN